MIWSGCGVGEATAATACLVCAAAAADSDSSSGSAVQQTNVLRNAAPSARLAFSACAYRTLIAPGQSGPAALPRPRLHPKAPADVRLSKDDLKDAGSFRRSPAR